MRGGKSQRAFLVNKPISRAKAARCLFILFHAYQCRSRNAPATSPGQALSPVKVLFLLSNSASYSISSNPASLVLFSSRGLYSQGRPKYTSQATQQVNPKKFDLYSIVRLNSISRLSPLSPYQTDQIGTTYQLSRAIYIISSTRCSSIMSPSQPLFILILQVPQDAPSQSRRYYPVIFRVRINATAVKSTSLGSFVSSTISQGVVIRARQFSLAGMLALRSLIVSVYTPQRKLALSTSSTKVIDLGQTVTQVKAYTLRYISINLSYIQVIGLVGKSLCGVLGTYYVVYTGYNTSGNRVRFFRRGS